MKNFSVLSALAVSLFLGTISLSQSTVGSNHVANGIDAATYAAFPEVGVPSGSLVH